MKKLVWIQLLFLVPILIWGQGKRYSEEEVMIQNIFIEANKEKILGNYESAASLYRQVLGKDPRNSAAAYELSRVYDVMDQDKEALQSISLAVSINPVNNWYQMFKADIYEKQKDFNGAASVFSDLIKYFPSEDYYYYRQAYYLVKANEVIKAIKVYNELEDRIGITEDLTKKKFNLYLGIDNRKKATQELVKLVKAYPSDIDYRLDLAQFYLQTDRKEQAKKEFAQVLKIDPNNGEAGIVLASNDKTTKGGSSQLELLSPIFANPATHIDTKIKELIPIIQNIADGKDKSMAPSAMQLAQILEDTHPNEAKAFSAYGDLLFYTGNIDAAKEKYKKAISLDKNVFSIWEQLFSIYELQNDYEALVKISGDAQVYFPNQAKAYYFNGIGHYGLGAFKLAVQAFKRTLLMTRKDPLIQFDVNHRLILTYRELENWEAAALAYEKAASLNPENPGILTSYASTLARQQGKIAEAMSLIKKADNLLPNQARIQGTYANILAISGDLNKAKDWFEKAMKNGANKDSESLEGYGDLYYMQKDYNQARIYWQKAIDLNGNAKRLKRKIENAQTNN